MTNVTTTQEQLLARMATLEDELGQRVREAAEKEQQLERYAADLRETVMQERARARELRRSYMLTVRALASAVEARDAYTGRHAERVAAYGLRLPAPPPRGAGGEAAGGGRGGGAADRVRLPPARRRQGRRPRRDPLQAGSPHAGGARHHATAS